MKTNIQKTEINKTKKIPWSLGRNWFMQQHFLLQITQIHSSYLTVHVVNNPNQTGVYIFKKNDLIYTSSFSFFFYSRAWRNTLSIGFLWRVFWFDFDFFFFSIYYLSHFVRWVFRPSATPQLWWNKKPLFYCHAKRNRYAWNCRYGASYRPCTISKIFVDIQENGWNRESKSFRVFHLNN